MKSTADIISPQTAGTLDGVFRERVRRTPEGEAYRYYDHSTRSWQSVRWNEAAKMVKRWKTALSKEGLSPGDRVAVMLGNCLEWVLFDQAALALGLAVVPLYLNDRPENFAFILRETESRILLIDGLEQWKIIERVKDPLEDLQRIVTLHPVCEENCDIRIRDLEDWLPKDAEEHPVHNSTPEALATIVYTSGTTGRPKGVMLSHLNILSNAYSAMQTTPVFPDDLFLSFLPLSHMFERTVGYYIPIMTGACVAFARSIPELAQDLRTQKPTILVSVPRIFERIHSRIQAKLKKKPPFARKLFSLAVDVGWQYFEYRQGRVPWTPSLLLWPILKRLVASKIAARLGGRLRLTVSGGAPLFPSIARFFIGLGVPLIQGYGLTETSPIVSFNKPDDNLPSSVGHPLDGVETRVSEEGELLVKGNLIMLGYWRNEEATAEVIDDEGWFHTGDMVDVDETGRISITGRLKEIIILSNGENVPPDDLQLAIAMDPLFEQALVVGEGRPYLIALVVINEENWNELMLALGQDPEDYSLLQDKGVRATLLQRVADQLAPFPGYAKIRKVVPTFDAWDVESGLITPTLKPRREKIKALFKDEIEALYK